MTSSDRHTRRGFLQGKAVAHSLADAVRRAAGLQDTPSTVSPPAEWANAEPTAGRGDAMISIRRRAMACEFEVQLAAGCQAESTDCALAALDLVETLEDQMTVYRDESELMRVNRQAARAPVPVESRLFALLKLAARLHGDTLGALDVTSGPLSEVWGFSRRQGRLPDDAEIAAALQRVGMENVLLDESRRTVHFLKSGITLNLNCIGKGYALDRMAELLDAGGIESYLLHGGRSSVLARGDCPGGERAGWTIGVRHPLRPELRLAEFYLTNQALGTSGSGTQFFQHQGRRYGHLLDPRTGRPVSGTYTATVIAPTAAEADALSTAFYLMRPDEVGQFCAGRPNIAALLARAPERGGNEVEVLAFGLSESSWRPLAESNDG